MDAATKPAEKTARSGKRAIPAYLVREVIDGIPFYYRGYRQAMNKTKTLEELRGDGGLQFFLKLFLYDLLKARLNQIKFRCGSGELGFHPNYKNNMGLDVVVFDRKVLTPDKITAKFVEVPPRLVVEVDVNVELPDRDSDLFQEYVVRKIRRLFASGTEKVVWVFTKSQQVFSATADAPWQVYDWDQDVELMEGVSVNLANYMREEGFELNIGD